MRGPLGGLTEGMIMESEFDTKAEDAARTWLVQADAGDAAGTWAAAASLFRQAVPEDQWARSLNAARLPLGSVVSRTLRDAHPARELPGAPDGEYVVLQFETRFEHKRSAVETVTPMKDDDGTWRVSGYFIR
jgi:Protein of unknown function (DUF4019)